MINSVSNVSFRGDTAKDWKTLVESEGQYTQKPVAPAAPDSVEISTKQTNKKGGIGKTIAKFAAGVVVAGLALFGLSRGHILKVDEKATGLKKVGSKLAEAGEWIGKKCIDPIVNLFKGKGSKKAADTATNAGKAADDTAKAGEKAAEKASGDSAKAGEKVAEKASDDAAKAGEKVAGKASDDTAKAGEKVAEKASDDAAKAGEKAADDVAKTDEKVSA